MLISRVCRPIALPATFGRAPTIHAAEARKRRGQPDRPNNNFVRTWMGPTVANNSRSKRLRMAARSWELLDGALAVAVERDAVQLHSMVDEPEAELLGNPPLKRLQLFVDELDDVSRLHVDQVIVVSV